MTPRGFQTPTPKSFKKIRTAKKIRESIIKESLDTYVNEVQVGAIPDPNDHHFDRIQDAQKLRPLICPTT